MPRRGENIYKRKDGRWEGRYIKERIDGHTKYSYVYARTYKELKSKLQARRNDCLESLSDGGLLGMTRNNEFEVSDLNAIAAQWIEFNSPQLKKSTINKYKNILKSYILPRFRSVSIESITREDVIIFSNELLVAGGKDGRSLSPKTVVGVISVLQNVFEFSSQNKKLTTADISKISIKQFQKPFRVFSDSEQKSLCEFLYNELTCKNIGILLCLYTGIRIGELCALTWSDIHEDERVICINKTLQRIQNDNYLTPKTQIVISQPKSECSIRKIPIPDQLFNILLSKKASEQSFILTGNETRYIEPRNMQYYFKTVLRRCNIDDANFHTLRHTFATRCVEMGFDIKCLSEILGHANVNITLNRYVHPSMELKRKNMNMYSDLFTVK